MQLFNNEKFDIIKIDEELALDWYLTRREITVDDVDTYVFFKDLNEVFEYVYMDEYDYESEIRERMKSMSKIDVNLVLATGVNTIAEYLALDWDHLICTPYGYLKVELKK